MIDKPTAPTHDVNNVAYQIQAPPTGRIKISIIIVINFMKKRWLKRDSTFSGENQKKFCSLQNFAIKLRKILWPHNGYAYSVDNI